MKETIKEKLEKLILLQHIDKKLDELNQIKGDLPREIVDIEDDIMKYTTRLNNFEESLKELEEQIKQQSLSIKEAEKNIQSYEEKQMKVRNNREYDAITKEVEYQELEIQLLNKKNNQAKKEIELKKEAIQETQQVLSMQNDKLKIKQKELKIILLETEEEEEKIKLERGTHLKNIDERTLNYYKQLRNRTSNKLAIVFVKKDACGGCFSAVPPQQQLEIAKKNTIISCENCGRILADVEIEE